MNDLFDNITAKNKEKIFKILEVSRLKFKKGTTILQNRFGPNNLCLVNKGSLIITKNDPEGNSTIIEEVKEKDIFSTVFSIINEECEIICVEDAEIILFDYIQILKEEKKKYEFYNQFILNLLKITMIKIKEKNDHLDILSKKTIRDKLLQYFKIASFEQTKKTITLPFSYTIFADYLGVNRSAMSREIKNLKEEGFIKVNGRTITLLY